MKAKKPLTTFSTTLIVAGLAAVWGLTSPLTAGCALATPLEQIAPAPTESAHFVTEVNELRRSRGLPGLVVDGSLTAVAQDGARTMASQDGIFHRSDLRDGVSLAWKRLGENVGMGPNVSELMRAFIASPGHYKNLVDATFTHIGVGTARTPDGLLYTAHEFAAVEAASVSAPATVAPQPSAPRVSAPRVTAPRITAPPATAPPPPAPTTTEPPVAVERSAAHQHELQDSSAQNQQQQHDENKGRCRAHGELRVTV